MNSNYKLIENYRDNERLVKEFFQFTSSLFPSISFEKWAAKGFWQDTYKPFSLTENGRIVSNVCVSEMKILIHGKEHDAIQFSAVGTLPEYRKLGLSRRLMQHVLEKYRASHNFFFLYANESVAGFYPKFGFQKRNENKFVSNSTVVPAETEARKLNLNIAGDYKLLVNLLSQRMPLTKEFSAVDYSFITMWHIFNTFFENCYYLEEEEDAIVISEQSGNELSLYEVIYSEQIDIDTVLPKLLQNEVNKVNFYFPPDQIEFTYDEVLEEDTQLFLLTEKLQFHTPFRFPVTAAT